MGDNLPAAALRSYFADDTKTGVIKHTPDLSTVLQEALDCLTTWSNAWGMLFNEKKCVVMHFGHSNERPDYFLNGKKLKVVEEHKDIGIYIDNKLKFGKQTQMASNRSRAVLQSIAKSFSTRNFKLIRQVYCQHVRPHNEFCTTAWAPYRQGDIDRIENVQKKAINLVSCLPNNLTYEEKLVKMCLHSTKDRRTIADAVQMFQLSKNAGGLGLADLFELVDFQDPHRRETRQQHSPLNVKIKRFRHDNRGGFFTIRAARIWNEIPHEIKTANTKNAFRRQYISWKFRSFPNV